MKKKIISIGIVIISILIVFAIVSQSNIPVEPEPEPKEEPKETLEEKPEQNVESEIQADVIMPTKVSRPGCEENDRCYIPSQIVINKGESVIWENQDAAFHSVTSGEYGSPTGLFDSGYLDPYESFTFSFDQPGKYQYYCTLHPWMEGLVTVQEN